MGDLQSVRVSVNGEMQPNVSRWLVRTAMALARLGSDPKLIDFLDDLRIHGHATIEVDAEHLK